MKRFRGETMTKIKSINTKLVIVSLLQVLCIGLGIITYLKFYLSKNIDNNYFIYIIKDDEKLANVLNLQNISSRSMNNGMEYS